MAKKLFHVWDDWQRDAQRCVRFRRCKQKCNTCYEEVPDHEFGPWSYTDEKSCEQMRTCIHCGAVKTRVAECTFGEWVYVQSNSCRQFRVCSHCKTTEYRNGAHSFGDWRYHSNGSCERTRTCAHCGEQEFQISHKPQKKPGIVCVCQTDTHCSICGELISSTVGHNWSDRVLSYRACLENAIDYQQEKERRLADLISQYESDPMNPRYHKLRISEAHTKMLLGKFQHAIRTVQDGEVGSYCVKCMEPRYLGFAEQRSKRSNGFLSYCSEDRDYADRIDAALRDAGYLITRDIRDVDIGTKITAFMDRIETSEYVVLLISDQYLRSKYCMYEATKAILSLLKNNCRIIPIALDIDLGNLDVRNKYIQYWKQMHETAINDPTYVAEAVLYQDILECITEFFHVVTEHKYLSATASGVDDVLLSRVVDAVKEKVASESDD